MKRLFATLAFALVSSVTAAQPTSPPLYPPAPNHQGQPAREWHGDRDRIPRWCRGYDRRDYWQEMRVCGEDRRCRRDVRRKGERCGIR